MDSSVLDAVSLGESGRKVANLKLLLHDHLDLLDLLLELLAVAAVLVGNDGLLHIGSRLSLEDVLDLGSEGLTLLATLELSDSLLGLSDLLSEGRNLGVVNVDQRLSDVIGGLSVNGALDFLSGGINLSVSLSELSGLAHNFTLLDHGLVLRSSIELMEGVNDLSALFLLSVSVKGVLEVFNNGLHDNVSTRSDSDVDESLVVSLRVDASHAVLIGPEDGVVGMLEVLVRVHSSNVTEILSSKLKLEKERLFSCLGALVRNVVVGAAVESRVGLLDAGDTLLSISQAGDDSGVLVGLSESNLDSAALDSERLLVLSDPRGSLSLFIHENVILGGDDGTDKSSVSKELHYKISFIYISF